VFKYKRNIAVAVHSDLGEYKELIAERDHAAVRATPGEHPSLVVGH
jgi:hypothetical protein